MIGYTQKRLSQTSYIKQGLISMAAVALVLPVFSSTALAVQTFQFADMTEFGTSVETRGAETLTRGMEAFWLNMGLHGLDKKAAYTVWWVVFNAPD